MRSTTRPSPEHGSSPQAIRFTCGQDGVTVATFAGTPRGRAAAFPWARAPRVLCTGPRHPLTRSWCRRRLVRAGSCFSPLRSEPWSPAGRDGAPQGRFPLCPNPAHWTCGRASPTPSGHSAGDCPQRRCTATHRRSALLKAKLQNLKKNTVRNVTHFLKKVCKRKATPVNPPARTDVFAVLKHRSRAWTVLAAVACGPPPRRWGRKRERPAGPRTPTSQVLWWRPSHAGHGVGDGGV